MADKNVMLHDANGSNLYPKTKGANITDAVPISKGGTGATSAAGARNALGLGNTSGALPIANGGTGQTTAKNALNALLGHGSQTFNITAYVNSSYEKNFTYDTLGIPSGGSIIMATLSQTHNGTGIDDVYTNVWLGLTWNDAQRILYSRCWSNRSSQATVQLRLDYIYTL